MSKGPSLPSIPSDPLGGDPASPEDRKRRIRDSTSSGGLKDLPKEYEHPEGDWKTILSGNPFERLYLDSAQKETITTDMVRRNYEVLADFWKEKLWLLQGQDRDRIARKYGGGNAGKVRQHERDLEVAFERLSTVEGIEEALEELSRRRLEKGYAALSRYLDFALSNRVLDQAEIKSLVERGMEESLEDSEIASWLWERLQEKGLEPERSPAGASALERLLASGEWHPADQEPRNICLKGHPNRPSAKFCAQCGAPIQATVQREPKPLEPPAERNLIKVLAIGGAVGILAVGVFVASTGLRGSNDATSTESTSTGEIRSTNTRELHSRPTSGANRTLQASPEVIARLARLLSNGVEFKGSSWSRANQWPMLVQITFFDRSSGRVLGEVEWPTLNAVHRIEGGITGNNLVFTEKNYIQRGSADLGCVYELEIQHDRLVGNWGGCDSSTTTGHTELLPDRDIEARAAANNPRPRNPGRSVEPDARELPGNSSAAHEISLPVEETVQEPSARRPSTDEVVPLPPSPQ